jgi:hypothetical protein
MDRFRESDGIPVDALPLQPAASPSPVRDADFLRAAPEPRAGAAYEKSPRLAVLTTETDEPEDWLRGEVAMASPTY